MPLTYRQVKDLHDSLYDAGVTQEDLPTWAARKNAENGTDFYSAGLDDNFLKRSSVAIDRLLEKTPLPDWGAAGGRALGSLVGAPDVGETIGRGVPRGIVNFAPLIAAQATPVGWGADVAAAAGYTGLGLSSLLQGTQTYTETGSPAAGLISGATAAVLPSITGAAEHAAAAGLGAEVVKGQMADLAGNVTSNVNRVFPTTVTQKLGSFLGGQTAAAATLQAGQWGEQAAEGQPLTTDPKSLLLGMTLNTLPFTLAHLGGKGIKALRGTAEPEQTAEEVRAQVASSQVRIQLKLAADALAREQPVDSLPIVNPQRSELENTTALLASIRGQQYTTTNDPTLTPEEKAAKLTKLANIEAAMPKPFGPNTVLGNTIQEDEARTPIVGREVRRNADGSWRAVQVADDPRNPEEMRGKVVSYSTLWEPGVTDADVPPTTEITKTMGVLLRSRGYTDEQIAAMPPATAGEILKPQSGGLLKNYSLPHSQWYTVKTPQEWAGNKEVTPDLPPADKPLIGRVEPIGKYRRAGLTTDDYYSGLDEHLQQYGWHLQPDKDYPNQRQIVDSEGKLIGKVERTLSNGKLSLDHIGAAMDETGLARVSGQNLTDKVYQFDSDYAKTNGLAVESDLVNPITRAKFRQYFGEPKIVEHTSSVEYGIPLTASELQAHMEEIGKARAQVDNAVTPSDLQSGMIRLQHVQQQNNLPVTGDVALRQTAAGLKATGTVEDKDLTQVALKSEMSKTERQLQQLAKRTQDINTSMMFRQRMEDEIKTNPDPELVTELNNLKMLETVYLPSKRSKYADALASGELTRMYRDWVLGGRTGGFEAFEDAVKQTVRTGKGLIKNQDVLAAGAVKGLDGQPIRDVLGEKTADAVRDAPALARAAYDSWEGKATSTFEKDMGLYQLLRTQFSTADGSIDLGDAAAFFHEDKGIPVEQSKASLQEFMQRPHVKVWDQLFNEGIEKARQAYMAPPAAVPFMKAGDRWLYSLGPYNPETRVLNNKHPVPPSGVLSSAAFRNMAGVGRPLAESELQLYRTLVPGAFDMVPEVGLSQRNLQSDIVVPGIRDAQLALATDPQRAQEIKAQLFADKNVTPIVKQMIKQTNFEDINSVNQLQDKFVDETRRLRTAKQEVVNVPQLYEGLAKVTPVVHTDTREDSPVKASYFQQENETALTDRQVEIQHEMDTHHPDWDNLVPMDIPANRLLHYVIPHDADATTRRLLQEYNDLQDQRLENWPELVIDDSTLLPQNQVKWRGITPKSNMRGYIESLIQLVRKRIPQLDSGHTVDEAPLHVGRHFDKDANTIAFYRAYVEEHPDGTKSLHVIEVQSDWMKAIRDANEFRVDYIKKANEEIDSALEGAKDLMIIKSPATDDTPALATGMLLKDDGKAHSAPAHMFDALRTFATELPAGKHPITPELKARLKEESQAKINTRANAVSMGDVKNHPLLKGYETMALKAAIQHAKDVGATKLIISDGNTAMLTERHDRLPPSLPMEPEEIVRRINELKYPNIVAEILDPDQRTFGHTNKVLSIRSEMGTTHEKITPGNAYDMHQTAWELGADKLMKVFPELASLEPDQAKGMRLHYDVLLPRIMKALTGDAGTPIDLGIHQGVKRGETVAHFADSDFGRQESDRRMLEIQRDDPTVVVERHGSGPDKNDLVVYNVQPSRFIKDENGVPWKANSGRSFNLGDVPDAYTMTDPNRAPAAPFVPSNPVDQQLVDQIGTTGTSALAFAMQSPNPRIAAIAKGLAHLQDSLSRIDVHVMQGDNSAAMNMGNGRVKYELSSASLTDRNTLDFHNLHELIHGLSIVELDKPTNLAIRAELEALRAKVENQLPQKLKDRLGELRATDWQRQYSNGADYHTIFPGGTEEEKAILYSMLSTHEFVGMGLSSSKFQDYLRTIKSQGGVVTQFADNIRRLLKLEVENTAFADFLNISGRLLTQGDYVSTLSNYAEGYFRNLGMRRGEIDNLSRRVVGLMLSNPETTEDVMRLLADTGHLGSNQFAGARQRATLMFGDPNSQDYLPTAKLMDELGFQPRLNGMDDFVREASLGNVADHVEALALMPEVSADYAFSKLQDMQLVLKAMMGAVGKENAGVVNMINAGKMRAVSQEAHDAIEDILRVRADREAGKQIINEMGAIAPDAYADRHVGAPIEQHMAPVVEAFTKESIQKQKKGIAYWLEGAMQLARRDNRTSELLAKAATMEPQGRQFFGNSVRSFGIDMRSKSIELSGKVIKQVLKVLQKPGIERAVDQWLYQNNQVAKDEHTGVETLPPNHPKVMEILKGFSEDDQNAIKELVAKNETMTRLTHKQILEHMAHISSVYGAKVPMLDGKMRTEQAIALSGQVMDALLVDQTDPQAIQIANSKLNGVQQRMTPEAFGQLVDFLSGEVKKYKAAQEFFDNNPAWVSAQRQEALLVHYRLGGQQILDQASSKKEAYIRARGGTNIEIEPNLKGRDDEMPVLGPESEAVIARLHELQATQDAKAKQFMDPESWDHYKSLHMGVAEQFAREQAATGGAPKFTAPARLLSQGAERLPWFWNHLAWARRQSNYWTRQLFRAQANLHLNSPELIADPQMQKQLKDYVEAFMRPDSPLIQKINRFTSTWYMGFAPATALINGIQPVSTLVPELTAITDKPIQSYKTLVGALNEIRKASGGKKFSTPELDQFMREAEKAGQRGFSMWDELGQAHETVDINLQRFLKKNKPQDTWQRLAGISGAWSTAAMWMFKRVEQFNQDVALIAAFKTYRGMGQDYATARDNAFQTNLAVNYGGGRAGRAIGPYALEGQFARSFAMLATNMQNYNIGVVGQLSRYLRQGYFRPDGMKPAQVHAARTAAIQMLGTQLALAGLMGLPFVSGMLAVLNQAFPDLEVNKRAREFVHDLFTSDDEASNTMSDIAMNGLPSMFGWDMQSRLSWGNLTPGVSDYDGFQPEAMLGPPVNLVTGFINGFRKLGQGDSAGAEAFVPPGLKKMQQYLMNQGNIKDYKDRTLFTPTPGEVAGVALGFQPTRLQAFNTAQRIANQSQDLANRRQSQFYQEQATEALKGNIGTVRQAILARASQDKNFSPVAAVQGISKAAEDLSFPRDLRREGTANDQVARSRLLQTFNLQPNVGSEMDRLRFRTQLQQRLGLQTDTRHALRVAQMVDLLREKNPTASRVELVNQAERLLGGRERTLASPDEYQ